MSHKFKISQRSFDVPENVRLPPDHIAPTSVRFGRLSAFTQRDQKVKASEQILYEFYQKTMLDLVGFVKNS